MKLWRDSNGCNIYNETSARREESHNTQDIRVKEVSERGPVGRLQKIWRWRVEVDTRRMNFSEEMSTTAKNSSPTQ